MEARALDFEKMAEICYAKDDEKLRKKAMAAGRLINNRLKPRPTKTGQTHTFFDVANYMKYFSYDALGYDRVMLDLNARQNKSM